jgi:hypothetical protein
MSEILISLPKLVKEVVRIFHKTYTTSYLETCPNEPTWTLQALHF